MKSVLLIILLLIAGTIYADVFKSIDSQGNITYSDSPMNAQAERIELPTEENSITAENPDLKKTQDDQSNINATDTENSSMEEKQSSKKKPYTKFIMLVPANGATLQNQPTMGVELGIDPPLQKGDMVQIYLDGKTWGAPNASTNFEFLKPDRGTHQISAKLLDQNGKLLKQTNPHTVYIHQAHIPTSPPVRVNG